MSECRCCSEPTCRYLTCPGDDNGPGPRREDRVLACKPFIEKVRSTRGVPGWRVTIRWTGRAQVQVLTWQSRDEAFTYAHGIVKKYCIPGRLYPLEDGTGWVRR